MKILVTGGAGYIGSLLVQELLNKGYQVRVLDNLSFGQTSILPYFINENFEFVFGDIRHVETVKQAVRDVDVIIHLAGIVGAPACAKNPQLAEEVNYQGTVNINNAREPWQKLFYASTGSVYGKVEGICKEDLPTKPLSIYGDTKLRGEIEVMKKGNAIAYRFATAFGLSPRLRLDLLPNDFVFNALKNKYLVVYSKDFKRTFIHVKDIVDAYLFGIEHYDQMKDEVYNIGSEKMNKTKEEIVKIIREKIPFEMLFVDKGVPDPDQRDYEVSYEKIRSKGFEIKVDFNRGITEVIRGLQLVNISNPYSNIHREANYIVMQEIPNSGTQPTQAPARPTEVRNPLAQSSSRNTTGKKEGGLHLQGKRKQSRPDSHLVTVITVVYNDAAHIEETMLNVLNQNYNNIEYIIIDGGSTDGTVDIIEKYNDRLDYWLSEKDSGIADAMNKGINHATGDYVNFINSGDYFVSPNVFREIFSTPHNADLLYGGFIGNFEGRPVLCIALDSATDKAWQGMRACHSTLFAKLAILQKFRFDTKYRVSADGDFLARCVAEGCTFERLNTIVFRVGTLGTSYKNWLTGRLENWEIARKYFKSWRTDTYHAWGLLRDAGFRLFKKLTSLIGLYQLLRYIYRKKLRSRFPLLPKNIHPYNEHEPT